MTTKKREVNRDRRRAASKTKGSSRKEKNASFRTKNRHPGRSSPLPDGRRSTVAVSAVLQQYAERGVFTSFSRTGNDFRFSWLWNLPFHLTFQPAKKTLTFPVLLPHVPLKSELDAGIREFVQGCSSTRRPEHRRIDSRRLRVTCSNRASSVSISVRVLRGDYEYATRKAINLVNEIFLTFLSAHHHQYLVDHFHRPED